MKLLIEKLKALRLYFVSFSVEHSDVGKCTKCKFNDGKYQNCTVGSYYAEKGLNRKCYEGELWEATEH